MKDAIRMQKASFVFIDEFDAFYHFELSESVQKKVNEIIGVQIFTTTHNTDSRNSNFHNIIVYRIKENTVCRSNLTDIIRRITKLEEILDCKESEIL